MRGENTRGRTTLDQPLQTSPDLEVGTPTVSDTSPETGSSFTLSATVSNTGDGESVATTLRYYRSMDATITTSDTAVGTDAVSGLASSGSSAESISLTAPSTAGTYYYGACVDAVTDESDTTNNCSASVTVTVTELASQPDLIVDYFNIIILNPTLETSPGALVQLYQRVANVGDAASAVTTVRYYRSTDATITPSDTQVSTDAVPILAASIRFVETQNERLPTTPGTYYYGACVDAVVGESNTANNCSRSVKVTVPEPQPDLVVGSSVSVEDSNLNTGASFTLSATVRNAGDEQSGGVDAAVLPIDRFDDLFVGHPSRHGRGGGIGRLGDERRVDLADGAGDGGHVLLRGVRGCGDGRVGHHEQLFIISDNRCGGAIIGAAGLEDRWDNYAYPY